MAPTLPMRPVGKQGLQAAAQGLGCMSLSKGAYGGEADIGPEEDRIAVIHSALSKGVTMLSTADLYGPYDNHELIGKALKNIPRDKITIASKWGPMTDGKGNFWMDSSPEYCRKSLEDSLKRMGTDYVDLYIMRSVDGKTPIEESVKAMAELVKEGKVKYIGLSEIAAEDIRKAHAVHPITAVEMEWSLFTRDAEDDLVPTCRELGIAFLAYSPLGRGMLTGTLTPGSFSAGDFRERMAPRFSKDAMLKGLWYNNGALTTYKSPGTGAASLDACLPLQNQILVDRILELAKKKGCKAGQLALAWVHHQGDDVFPIPGTKKLKYLEENVAAFGIKLSKEEMAELETAVPRDAVVGDRYPGMSHMTYHYAKASH